MSGPSDVQPPTQPSKVDDKPVPMQDQQKKPGDFGPTTLTYLKNVFGKIDDPANASLKDNFLTFTKSRSDPATAQTGSAGAPGLNTFLSFTHSQDFTAVAPFPKVDLSRPLSDYFVSSSHNTYLSGNQLYGRASTAAYKNVLLRGCRCVEIDVWDGLPPDKAEANQAASGDDKAGSDDGHSGGIRSKIKEHMEKFRDHGKTQDSPPAQPQDSAEDRRTSTIKDEVTMPTSWHAARAEPRVLHGHTATREVSFRDVVKTIGEYAFAASDLPLIISLEVHCNHEQQAIMVEIMTETWRPHLVDLPSAYEQVKDQIPLPSLADLRNKILIKVKYTAPKKEPTLKDLSLSRTTSKTSEGETLQEFIDSSSEEEEAQAFAQAEKAKRPEKEGKIVAALSNLGIYTRSVHFKSFTMPEAKIPTHVFAMSEKSIVAAHTKDPTALFRHNQRFLMRAYPKGTRIISSNLDPAPFWSQGVQMVALNWQTWDEGTMLNEAMFSGSQGWVDKPSGYRSSDQDGTVGTSEVYKSLDVQVEFLCAQNLPLPPGSKPTRALHPQVRCELHASQETGNRSQAFQGGTRAKDSEYKFRSKKAKGLDPDFLQESCRFADLKNVVPTLTFLRFKIMEDEFMNDELIAWACIRLDRVRTGLRFIYLYDANGIPTSSVLLVRISVTVK